LWREAAMAIATAILMLLNPAVDEKEGILLFSSALLLLPMKAERWYHIGNLTVEPIKGQRLKPCQTR
jgi:hypothetical protein